VLRQVALLFIATSYRDRRNPVRFTISGRRTLRGPSRLGSSLAIAFVAALPSV